MTKANDLAFPVYVQNHLHVGLSKREYFAAMAMQGIISNHGMIDSTNWDWLSEQSVNAADALMNALNETK